VRSYVEWKRGNGGPRRVKSEMKEKITYEANQSTFCG